jgi:transcriptional regulator with XRE-family HTH domain
MSEDDIPGIVRRGRRAADMSQRELAKAAGVGAAVIGSVESGSAMPSLRVLLRLLSAVGFSLKVIDASGAEVAPYDGELKRDEAGRLFPAHLDVRPVGPDGEGWWGYRRVMPWQREIPAYTFDRLRLQRDYLRKSGSVS